MADLQDDLRARLAEMAEGDVQVVAMLDRGDYPDELSGDAPAAIGATDADTGASRALMSGFAAMAEGVKASDEDVVTVQRRDAYTPMTSEDYAWFADQLTAVRHLVFVQCLDLGTTEIKGFLLLLAERGLLAASKVFLLDLPQIEYMTLRDALAGKVAL